MGMDGHICKACGGMVDAQGYSVGSEVEAPSSENEMGPLNPEEISDDSPQQELNKRMRREALAAALRKGGK